MAFDFCYIFSTSDINKDYFFYFYGWKFEELCHISQNIVYCFAKGARQLS